MNYEKFNDAMCKLRQAEEDLNKLRCSVAAATNEVDRKPQKFQESNDEEYRKGLKDLYEAFRIIAAEDGMSASDLKDAFGTCSICDIVLGFTSEEIIGKALEWKTKQKKEEQELHVGDEIITDNGLIGIITDVCDDDGTVWLSYRLTPATRGLDFCWAYNAKCKKTGRHFDNIPFDYNPEKEEETNK